MSRKLTYSDAGVNRKIREKYWIDNTKCVNKNNVVITEMKKYHKEYREKNKDKIKKYHKQYNKQKRIYQNSWGNDLRFHNNLLLIDVDLFR